MYERENEQDFEEVLQDGLRELIAQDGDYRTADDMCWENLRVQTYSEDGLDDSQRAGHQPAGRP